MNHFSMMSKKEKKEEITLKPTGMTESSKE